jgi:hypothetical protein
LRSAILGRFSGFGDCSVGPGFEPFSTPTGFSRVDSDGLASGEGGLLCSPGAAADLVDLSEVFGVPDDSSPFGGWWSFDELESGEGDSRGLSDGVSPAGFCPVVAGFRSSGFACFFSAFVAFAGLLV